ncbi:hypothetical protein D1872_216990 [compost metagenome]
MLVGAVVHDKVHDELHPSLMQPGKQLLPIRHRAEFAHNALVVADIVSVIVVRRFVNRTQPNHIDPQQLEVIQLGDNPAQIPDPIPIAVHKTAGIDLIHNAFFPPFLHHFASTPLADAFVLSYYYLLQPLSSCCCWSLLCDRDAVARSCRHAGGNRTVGGRIVIQVVTVPSAAVRTSGSCSMSAAVVPSYNVEPAICQHPDNVNVYVKFMSCARPSIAANSRPDPMFPRSPPPIRLQPLTIERNLTFIGLFEIFQGRCLANRVEQYQQSVPFSLLSLQWI